MIKKSAIALLVMATLFAHIASSEVRLTEVARKGLIRWDFYKEVDLLSNTITKAGAVIWATHTSAIGLFTPELDVVCDQGTLDVYVGMYEADKGAVFDSKAFVRFDDQPPETWEVAQIDTFPKVRLKHRIADTSRQHINFLKRLALAKHVVVRLVSTDGAKYDARFQLDAPVLLFDAQVHGEERNMGSHSKAIEQLLGACGEKV